MRRWLIFIVCIAFGLVALLCGLLVPMHLRAVDSNVIRLAGKGTSTVIDHGLLLVRDGKLGAAQLLLNAAQMEELPDRQKLGLAVEGLSLQNPGYLVFGGAEPRLKNLFEKEGITLDSRSEPFTEFIVRLENREKVLEYLQASPRPLVQELLRCRGLTNTVLFPPSSSSSGQAFDAALSICGLLAEGGNLTPGLADMVARQASEANRGGSSQRLEQFMMDLMSLGQRLNWGQLTVFTASIQDAETLRLLASQVRNARDQLPVLFAAVNVSGKPAAVAKYLSEFSQTGLADVSASLRFGSGGLNELLQRNQRLQGVGFGARVAQFLPVGAYVSFMSNCCRQLPWMSLAAKWMFFLLAGFLIAEAFYFAKPAVSVLQRPLQVRGIHVAREFLFALGFLLVVLLLSEPFLSQESQKVDFPFRLRLPIQGGIVPAGNVGAHSSVSFMNQPSLLILLLFFVLQGLIYTACLVKLAEIRRQKVPQQLKLKLLENEDHLFDSGLYLGFVGTIISLILVSLGVVKPSLMAAYSSTSFGIIFVSIFKIFHLRPVRRNMLMEIEASSKLTTPANTPS